MRLPRVSSIPRLSGYLTLLLGVAGFASWWSPLPALSGLPLNGTHVNPVTALVLAILGAGVLARASAYVTGSASARVAALACGAALLAIAAIRLGASLGLWAFRIDALPVPNAAQPLVASQMAPLSAAASACGGLGLLVTPPRDDAQRALGQALFLAVLLIATTALVGHLYEANAFHGPMAVVTGVG